MDVAARRSLEAAERDLDRFVDSRSKGRKKANALANELAQAERTRLQKRRQENQAAWAEHYLGMAASHSRLAADYARQALELLGIKEGENSA